MAKQFAAPTLSDIPKRVDSYYQTDKTKALR